LAPLLGLLLALLLALLPDLPLTFPPDLRLGGCGGLAI